MTPSSTKSFRNVLSPVETGKTRAPSNAKLSKFPLRRPDTPPRPAVNPVNSIKVIK